MKDVGILLAEESRKRCDFYTYTVTINIDYKSVSSCFYPLLAEEWLRLASIHLCNLVESMNIDNDALTLFGHSLGAYIFFPTSF